MKKTFYNPVNLFYLFVVFYIVIVPVDSGFLIKCLAFLFVFSIWIVCFLGRHSFQGSAVGLSYSKSSKVNPPRFILALVVFFQFYLAVFAGNFYTGMTFPQALINVFSGVSNYSAYQSYFAQEGLGNFSFLKLPAVFAFFLVKLIFIYFLFFSLINKKNKFDILLVIFSTFPVLVIGIFRGTSIEFFEVFVAFICAIYIRSRLFSSGKFPVFRVFMGAIVVASVYSIQVNFRYNFDYMPSCKNEFCYNSESIVYQIFPITYKLSSYFYFGPDYMARLFSVVLNEGSFLSLLLPGNGEVFGYFNKWLCEGEIQCGPTWAPDFEISLYIFGIPATIILIFLISRVQKALENLAHIDFIRFLGFFILTLQLIAFPIGNFIFVSSANQLLLITFILLFALKKFSVGKSGGAN